MSTEDFEVVRNCIQHNCGDSLCAAPDALARIEARLAEVEADLSSARMAAKINADSRNEWKERAEKAEAEAHTHMSASEKYRAAAVKAQAKREELRAKAQSNAADRNTSRLEARQQRERAEKAEAETSQYVGQVARLTERVIGLEADREHWKANYYSEVDVHAKALAERDALRAEVERLRVGTDNWQSLAHERTGQFMAEFDHVETLQRQLAKARAEELERAAKELESIALDVYTEHGGAADMTVRTLRTAAAVIRALKTSNAAS